MAMAPGQQAGAGMNMGVMTPAMQAQVSLFRWETHLLMKKLIWEISFLSVYGN